MAAAAACRAAAFRSAVASPAAAFLEGLHRLARLQEGCRQEEEALVRRQKEEVLVRRQKEEGPVRHQQEEGLARRQKEGLVHLQQVVVLLFSKE